MLIPADSDHPSLWRIPPSEGTKVSSPRSIEANSKLDAIYDLRNVVRVLRQQGFRDVIGIYGASTPIVKFKTDAPDGGSMECDLNINDLGGW